MNNKSKQTQWINNIIDNLSKNKWLSQGLIKITIIENLSRHKFDNPLIIKLINQYAMTPITIQSALKIQLKNRHDEITVVIISTKHHQYYSRTTNHDPKSVNIGKYDIKTKHDAIQFINQYLNLSQ